MQDSIYLKKNWSDKFIYRAPEEPWDAERVQRILAMIPSDVRTVLDVGTGSGYIYKELKKKGLDCAGIEISRDLANMLGDPKVCVADARAIPFGSGGFDLVLAADVLEHIQEGSFPDTVSELVRVAKKYILVNSPYKDAIDWPVSLCTKCGREFNIYGHMRVVDMALIKRYFPEESFEFLTVRTFGSKRQPRPSAMVRLARRWGRVYSKEGTVCPHCFDTSPGHLARTVAQEFFGKAVCAIFFIMDTITPDFVKPASEIAVLLRKKGA